MVYEVTVNGERQPDVSTDLPPRAHPGEHDRAAVDAARAAFEATEPGPGSYEFEVTCGPEHVSNFTFIMGALPGEEPTEPAA
jgi:hypothetical protein